MSINNLDKFINLTYEDVDLINLKIGYTQGELNEDFNDFEDSFNAQKHTYWNFTIIKDETIELDCDYLLIDWSSSDSFCLSSDEDIADKIAHICSKSSEDMFGDTIAFYSFESIVMGVLDEPDGNECIDLILESIGGTLDILEDTVKIPQEYVNSLYCLHEQIDSENIIFRNQEIIVDDKSFDIGNEYKSNKTIVFFSEDVMNY